MSTGNDGKGEERKKSPLFSLILSCSVSLFLHFRFSSVPISDFSLPFFYEGATEKERGTQAYETNPSPRTAKILAKTCKI